MRREQGPRHAWMRLAAMAAGRRQRLEPNRSGGVEAAA